MHGIKKKFGCMILPIYLSAAVMPAPVYAEEVAVQTEGTETAALREGEKSEVKLPLSAAEYTMQENEYIRIVSQEKKDDAVILTVEAVKLPDGKIEIQFAGDSVVTVAFEAEKPKEEPAQTEEKTAGEVRKDEKTAVDPDPSAEVPVDTEVVPIAETLYEIAVDGGKLSGEFVTENNVTMAKAGAKLTVKAAGKTGYLFTSWSLSGLSGINKKSSEIEFVMPEGNVSLNANYLYRWTENDNGIRYIVSVDQNNSKKYAKSQWIAESGKWYYFDINGYALRNTLKTITNAKGVSHTYFFREDCTMAVGWQKVGSYYYHFTNDGYMSCGWYRNGTVWYYLNPSNGRMLTGWLELKGKRYYFRNDGQMVTGKFTVDGIQYSFDSNGVLQTNCWIKLNNVWYYLDSTGQFVTGWKEIKGKKYFFLEDGKMAVGWAKNDGKWYYFDANGNTQKGWKQINGKWYWFENDGVMKTGWLTDDKGKTYFLKSSGEMAVGWAKNDGEWYYFDSSGAVVKTGWKKIGNYWYYLGKTTGKMKTGWYKEGDIWYFFKPGGEMAVGWAKDGAKWYYFNSAGAMQKGWKQISGKWYMLGSDGAMRVGWYKEAGKWYYLKSSGEMAVGWTKDGNSFYYMNKSGVMQTGWLTIGRNKYYLKSSGEMTTGIAKVDGLVRYFDAASGVLKNIEVPVSAADIVTVSSSKDEKSNPAAAALLTALNAKGYGSETYDVFLSGMPLDATNPMKGYFAGVIHSIYPKAACDWISTYGKTDNISGSTAEAVLNYVNEGKLVVVWIPADFSAGAKVSKASYGSYIENTSAAVVYGYDSLTGEVMVVDPSGKGLMKIPFDTFKTAYEKLKYGITIY